MDFDRPHRRYNLLTGEWVLVSPQRDRRPWLGQVEKVSPETLLAYDPTCYLCPGNLRSGGMHNPVYTGTFLFDNDFSALLPPSDNNIMGEKQTDLFRAEPEAGQCRVICYSPRHDLTLPELSLTEVKAVIRTWSDQTIDLASRDFIHYVQVFENKGAMMGCSNPHPHSQVWAIDHIPTEPAKEWQQQTAYLNQHGACLLCDLLSAELQKGERVVVSNADFTALVPFWANWPFEILLIAHRHTDRLPVLTPSEVTSLADIIRRVTARYDNLFEISFPYSMGFHQAPFNGQSCPGWHLHAHFYPPLLRSATVRKFMVGFELLGMPQRDLTPETAAARLRGLSEVHYKKKL